MLHGRPCLDPQNCKRVHDSIRGICALAWLRPDTEQATCKSCKGHRPHLPGICLSEWEGKSCPNPRCLYRKITRWDFEPHRFTKPSVELNQKLKAAREKQQRQKQQAQKRISKRQHAAPPSSRNPFALLDSDDESASVDSDDDDEGDEDEQDEDHDYEDDYASDADADGSQQQEGNHAGRARLGPGSRVEAKGDQSEGADLEIDDEELYRLYAEPLSEGASPEQQPAAAPGGGSLQQVQLPPAAQPQRSGGQRAQQQQQQQQESQSKRPSKQRDSSAAAAAAAPVAAEPENRRHRTGLCQAISLCPDALRGRPCAQPDCQGYHDNIEGICARAWLQPFARKENCTCFGLRIHLPGICQVDWEQGECPRPACPYRKGWREEAERLRPPESSGHILEQVQLAMNKKKQQKTLSKQDKKKQQQLQHRLQLQDQHDQDQQAAEEDLAAQSREEQERQAHEDEVAAAKLARESRHKQARQAKPAPQVQPAQAQAAAPPMSEKLKQLAQVVKPPKLQGGDFPPLGGGAGEPALQPQPQPQQQQQQPEPRRLQSWYQSADPLSVPPQGGLGPGMNPLEPELPMHQQQQVASGPGYGLWPSMFGGEPGGSGSAGGNGSPGSLGDGSLLLDGLHGSGDGWGAAVVGSGSPSGLFMGGYASPSANAAQSANQGELPPHLRHQQPQQQRQQQQPVSLYLPPGSDLPPHLRQSSPLHSRFSQHSHPYGSPHGIEDSPASSSVEPSDMMRNVNWVLSDRQPSPHLQPGGIWGQEDGPGGREGPGGEDGEEEEPGLELEPQSVSLGHEQDDDDEVGAVGDDLLRELGDLMALEPRDEDHMLDIGGEDQLFLDNGSDAADFSQQQQRPSLLRPEFLEDDEKHSEVEPEDQSQLRFCPSFQQQGFCEQPDTCRLKHRKDWSAFRAESKVNPSLLDGMIAACELGVCYNFCVRGCCPSVEEFIDDVDEDTLIPRCGWRHTAARETMAQQKQDEPACPAWERGNDCPLGRVCPRPHPTDEAYFRREEAWLQTLCPALPPAHLSLLMDRPAEHVSKPRLHEFDGEPIEISFPWRSTLMPLVQQARAHADWSQPAAALGLLVPQLWALEELLDQLDQIGEARPVQLSEDAPPDPVDPVDDNSDSDDDEYGDIRRSDWPRRQPHPRGLAGWSLPDFLDRLTLAMRHREVDLDPFPLDNMVPLRSIFRPRPKYADYVSGSHGDLVKKTFPPPPELRPMNPKSKPLGPGGVMELLTLFRSLRHCLLTGSAADFADFHPDDALGIQNRKLMRLQLRRAIRSWKLSMLDRAVRLIWLDPRVPEQTEQLEARLRRLAAVAPGLLDPDSTKVDKLLASVAESMAAAGIDSPPPQADLWTAASWDPAQADPECLLSPAEPQSQRQQAEADAEASAAPGSGSPRKQLAARAKKKQGRKLAGGRPQSPAPQSQPQQQQPEDAILLPPDIPASATARWEHRFGLHPDRVRGFAEQTEANLAGFMLPDQVDPDWEELPAEAQERLLLLRRTVDRELPLLALELAELAQHSLPLPEEAEQLEDPVEALTAGVVRRAALLVPARVWSRAQRDSALKSLRPVLERTLDPQDDEDEESQREAQEAGALLEFAVEYAAAQALGLERLRRAGGPLRPGAQWLRLRSLPAADGVSNAAVTGAGNYAQLEAALAHSALEDEGAHSALEGQGDAELLQKLHTEVLRDLFAGEPRAVARLASCLLTVLDWLESQLHPGASIARPLNPTQRLAFRELVADWLPAFTHMLAEATAAQLTKELPAVRLSTEEPDWRFKLELHAPLALPVFHTVLEAVLLDGILPTLRPAFLRRFLGLGEDLQPLPAAGAAGAADEEEKDADQRAELGVFVPDLAELRWLRQRIRDSRPPVGWSVQGLRLPAAGSLRRWMIRWSADEAVDGPALLLLEARLGAQQESLDEELSESEFDFGLQLISLQPWLGED